jgi:DNA-binding NarL/FixJ family response regulator
MCAGARARNLRRRREPAAHDAVERREPREDLPPLVDVARELVGRRRRDDPLESLTPREREVLELMAEGKSNQAIAETLVITLRAVEKHVTSIFTKLRLSASEHDHRRVLAVLTFLRS